MEFIAEMGPRGFVSLKTISTSRKPNLKKKRRRRRRENLSFPSWFVVDATALCKLHFSSVSFLLLTNDDNRRKRKTRLPWHPWDQWDVENEPRWILTQCYWKEKVGKKKTQRCFNQSVGVKGKRRHFFCFSFSLLVKLIELCCVTKFHSDWLCCLRSDRFYNRWKKKERTNEWNHIIIIFLVVMVVALQTISFFFFVLFFMEMKWKKRNDFDVIETDRKVTLIYLNAEHHRCSMMKLIIHR